MSDENIPEAPAPDAAAPEVNPLEAELAKAKDDMLRALADAQNTRRRAEKEAADARIYAIDKFARDLLPVADTLFRALATVSPEVVANNEAAKTLYDGVELTERSLVEAFSRHGLKRVGVRGETFNPNLHQAVAQAPSDQPNGTVLEVLQHGYMLSDRTLRAAMVLVSSGPAAQAPGEASIDIKV